MDKPVRDRDSLSSRSKQLERIVKGFANHWRIEILDLLVREPELSLGQIAERRQMDIKTASEHVRRMAIAGLVLKRYQGREVRHRATPRGETILTFLRKLE